MDEIYLEILRKGMPLLQMAITSRNEAWMDAEIDMLHNIPSLIGESNLHRHEYYWTAERIAYIDAILKIGGDPVEYMQLCYDPLWVRLERLMSELLTHGDPE